MLLQLKKVPVIFLLLIAGAGVHAQTPHLPPVYPSAAGNYIKVWEPTKPITLETDVINPQRLLKEVKQTTQFFDGLGRPIQTVIKQGSMETGQQPTDMVAPVIYDEFGRENRKYLPFSSTTADGSFKMDAFQQQKNFYDVQLAGQNETYYYGQTKFEASPLNRPEESFAPGNSWAGTQNQTDPNLRRSIKVKYWINTLTDDVKIWNVGNVANGFGSYSVTTNINNGIYPAGELYKTVTIDEHSKQVIEFKDKEGKVILKKVQNTATADDGTGSAYLGWLCTYYIYDDLNNLRCVIQPQAVKLMSEAANWNLTSYLDEQCFRYEYDTRNRMSMKKVPGAGAVYMVYDARDRLVLTQDANMRTGTVKWMYTTYDELNRPVATGLLTDAVNTHLYHQQQSAASTSYPNLALYTTEELSRTFYDDYDWLASQGMGFTKDRYTGNDHFFLTPDNGNFPYPQAMTQSFQTRGMVTGTKVKVLGSAQYMTTAMFYDDKGRVIQTRGYNYTNGENITTIQYSFSGQMLVKNEQTNVNGSPGKNTWVNTKYTYDDLGRLLTTRKELRHHVNGVWANVPEKEIGNHEYDKLGQLKKKKLAPYHNGSGLENLTYDYNIRGWLLGTNRSYIKDAATNYFGFELAYDKTANIINGQTYTALRQYNGNITGTTWKSAGDSEKRKFDYTYDAANRLTGANFNQFTSGGFNTNAGLDFSVSNVTFDANGNILTMSQKGWKVGGSNFIDQMTYSYFTNTNKLKAVTDAVTVDQKLGDFTDKNTTATDYGYDRNGNLVTDLNKQMGTATGVDLTTGGAITYNHLNLPSVITVTGKGTITYTYDAGGNKLKKVAVESPSAANGNKTITTTTSYINGFIYESKTTVPANNPNNDYTDRLQFTGHEEGRIRALYTNVSTPNTITGFAYDYMLKDHLGNVRMVLTDELKNDPYPALSFEGASGSQVVTDQNKFWENKDGQSINVTGTGVRIARPGGFGTAATNGSFVQRLRKSTGAVGATKLLKVMSGDKIHVRVDYFYTATNANNGTANGLTSFIASLLGNLSTSSSIAEIIKGEGAVITSGLNSNTDVVNFFSPQNPSGGTNQPPKAYLHVLLFDELFKFDNANSYVKQVDYQPNSKGTIDKFFGNAVQVKKNGYAYVYISNESEDFVYFDNLLLTHERGPILEETHYYPFGLVMNGISSKAINTLENKKKYNGIEFENDFDLNLYDAELRELDPQIGRWWQIDPETENMESWSPYVSNYNNPISYTDPRGDFPSFSPQFLNALANFIYFAAGYANTFTSNSLFGGGRIDITQETYNNIPLERRKFFVYGQLAGDVASIASGYQEAVAGGGGEVLSFGLGTEVAVPLVIHGISRIINATIGLQKGIEAIIKLNSSSVDDIYVDPSDKIPRDELNPPNKPGNAPTFKKDGKPVNLHHKDQAPEGPFKEMHPTDHTGKGNDKINHPNKNKPSKVDRKKFNKQRRDYWKREYPSVLPKSKFIKTPNG